MEQTIEDKIYEVGYLEREISRFQNHKRRGDWKFIEDKISHYQKVKKKLISEISQENRQALYMEGEKLAKKNLKQNVII